MSSVKVPPKAMWCSAMPHHSVGATTTGVSPTIASAVALHRPSLR